MKVLRQDKIQQDHENKTFPRVVGTDPWKSNIIRNRQLHGRNVSFNFSEMRSCSRVW